MARLSFRCDEELVARVDVCRGDVPRERWLRRAVERELAHVDGSARREAERYVTEKYGLRPPVGEPASVEQPRQPDPPERELIETEVVSRPVPDAHRSSLQAKRDVRPMPKGER